MFFKTKEEEADIEKRKELIDEEVHLYEVSKRLSVDSVIVTYRMDQFKKVEKIAVECAQQIGEYEHEFHFAKQTKGIELAKLDAEIKDKQARLDDLGTLSETSELMNKYKAESDSKGLVIANQKETIKLLDDSVKVVVGKLSTIDIKSLGLNVTTSPAK